jgi:hypothetical protein
MKVFDIFLHPRRRSTSGCACTAASRKTSTEMLVCHAQAHGPQTLSNKHEGALNRVMRADAADVRQPAADGLLLFYPRPTNRFSTVPSVSSTAANAAILTANGYCEHFQLSDEANSHGEPCVSFFLLWGRSKRAPQHGYGSYPKGSQRRTGRPGKRMVLSMHSALLGIYHSTPCSIPKLILSIAGFRFQVSALCEVARHFARFCVSHLIF